MIVELLSAVAAASAPPDAQSVPVGQGFGDGLPVIEIMSQYCPVKPPAHLHLK